MTGKNLARHLFTEAGRHAAEDADDEDSCEEEDNTLHEDCTDVQANYGSELENDDDGDGVDDKGDNPVKDAADIEENRVAEDMATAKGHEKSGTLAFCYSCEVNTNDVFEEITSVFFMQQIKCLSIFQLLIMYSSDDIKLHSSSDVI